MEKKTVIENGSGATLDKFEDPGSPPNVIVATPRSESDASDPASISADVGINDDPQNMSKAERYWHDECIKAREDYAKVAPLAPYIDVIAYLDANADATKLVMEHMGGSHVGNQSANNEIDNAMNENLGTSYNTQGRQSIQDRDMKTMGGQVADALRKQHMDLLKERGIPEDEADRYVKFLINPGDLTPEEMFGMYSSLRDKRGEPISSNPTNPDNPGQKSDKEPAKSNGQPELPPASIVGMSGDSDSPESDQGRVSQSRYTTMLDPNNL